MLKWIAALVGGIIIGILAVASLPFLFAASILFEVSDDYWHAPLEPMFDEYPSGYFTPTAGMPHWILGDWQVSFKGSSYQPCPPNGGYRFTSAGVEMFTRLRRTLNPHDHLSFGPGTRDLKLNSYVMREVSPGFIDTLVVEDSNHWVPPESEAELMREIARRQGLPEDDLIKRVMPTSERAHELVLRRCPAR